MLWQTASIITLIPERLSLFRYFEKVELIHFIPPDPVIRILLNQGELFRGSRILNHRSERTVTFFNIKNQKSN